MRVPAAGGAPVTVVAPREGGFVRSPSFLPDGEHFLYTEDDPSSQKVSLKVGDLSGKLSKELLADRFQCRICGTGLPSVRRQ